MCCPWNILRLFGIRKIRSSAEGRRVRDGVYSLRRSNRYWQGHVITLFQSCFLFCVLLATSANPKKGGNMFVSGSLADKTSCTGRHTLNFVYTFWRRWLTGNYSNINGRVQETWQGFLWHYLQGTDKLIQSSWFQRVGLANAAKLLLHGEPTVKHDTQFTGRIIKKVCRSGQFLKHQENQIIWKGRKAVFQSYLHSAEACRGWSTCLRH